MKIFYFILLSLILSVQNLLAQAFSKLAIMDKVQEHFEATIDVKTSLFDSGSKKKLLELNDGKLNIAIDFDSVPFEERLARAKTGDRESIVMLAWRYYLGVSVEKDLRKALEYCDRAKELDMDDLNAARRNIETELALEELFKKGEQFAILKAQSGDAKSAYFISIAYGNGLNGLEKNKEEAKKYMELSASLGYPRAYVHYAYDLRENGDLQESQKWLKKGVEAGDVEACLAMFGACTFNKEWGIENDEKTAAECLKNAVQAGDYRASLQMAYYYWREDMSQKKDEQLAEKYFIKAASQGMDDALSAVIDFYEKKGDIENALKWARKAYSFDMKKAPAIVVTLEYRIFAKKCQQEKLARQAELKRQLENGAGWDIAKEYLSLGVANSDKEIWLRKFALEEKNDEAIPMFLDFLDKNFNRDSKNDCSQYLIDFNKLYELAVPKKIAKAYLMKAMLIREKFIPPTETDANVEIEKLLKTASDLGSGEASFLLSDMSLKTNVQESRKFLEKACEQDCPEALFYYGKMFVNGRDVKVDESKGIEYISRAAQLGLPNAIYYMGSYYEAKHDYEKAEEFYSKASLNGVSDAFIGLGELYTTDDFPKKDACRALKYFSTAAEMRNVRAFFPLGVMYFCGIGTEKDEKIASLYFYAGAKNGDFKSLCYHLSILATSEDEELSNKKGAILALKELVAQGYYVNTITSLIEGLSSLPKEKQTLLDVYAYAKFGASKTPKSKYFPSCIEFFEKEVITSETKSEYEDAAKKLAEKLSVETPKKKIDIPLNKLLEECEKQEAEKREAEKKSELQNILQNFENNRKK